MMTTKHHLYLFVLVLFVASFFLTGCSQGPNTAHVTGVVTIDGETVEGVQLRFSPVSRERSSMGYTDANGRYLLRFTETETGCIPGDHVVRITAYRDPDNDMSQFLPIRYNEAADENEEMNITVKKGRQEVNFSLTSE